jgi:hypothetical protein
MKSMSVTELSSKLIGMEQASLARIEALTVEVRSLRLRLEAEIEVTERFLASLEEV